ncbi:alpha/beta hydrolase [Metabacillus malikii]|uniref:Carboxylesterase n=1 Tax=Metabacillus malikii TaxID=1504265 RepID=A0ABT9ZJL2_9BACI|nr:alpha/beta fold hydrolase [Metabacillus malikii]MDQ0232480.1 carboxylesterase [Metabacillus malikii]
MKKEQYPILPGADSIFINGNKIGVLLCHGFNGTPQSMQFIGEQLSNYGFTISIPRLAGHGTHYLDMENCIYQDWIDSLDDAFEKLNEVCEKVFIIGQSMGGALTLQVAASHHLEGIFLINAAVTEVCYQQFLEEEEQAYLNEGKPDIKKHDVYEITYDKVPLKSVKNLLLLMEDTKSRLHTVTAPTILFKSTTDHVVAPNNSEYIYKNIDSEEKQIIELENSYHVASMDNDANMIVEYVVEHIHKTLTKTSLV